MRALLHAERPALTRLLTRVDALERRGVLGTLSSGEHRRLVRELGHYSYLRSVRAVLHEEAQLAERFIRASAVVQRSNDEDVRRSYALRRSEIDSLLNLPATVADGTLERRLETVSDVIRRMPRTSDQNAVRPFIETIRSSTTRLRNELAAVSAVATIAVPAGLSLRGHDPVRAQRALDQYLRSCSALEYRLLSLCADAERLYECSGLPARRTLVLGAQSFAARDALERALPASADISRLSTVPYLAVELDVEEASSVLSRGDITGNPALRALYPARYYTVAPMVESHGEPRWNIRLVDAERAWKRTRGAGVAVAVIDTGIDFHHPEIEDRLPDGYGVDFIDYGPPMDYNGHGTHVAGTIAGTTVGVAPEATVYAVRVLDADGMGSEVAVLQGIEWSIEQNIPILSMSLGSSWKSSAEEDLVAVAAMRNIAVIAAAGNDGDTSYCYPASYAGATSIAAVDSTKAHADFSNRNDKVALCAPGVSIYSLAPGGDYAVLSGTSMATPHVSGCCALVRAAGIADPVKALRDSAERLGHPSLYGAGLVQAGEAIGNG